MAPENTGSVVYPCTIVFDEDGSLPRWNLIRYSFYQQTKIRNGVVTAGPVFHVREGTPSFSVSVRLAGGVFSKEKLVPLVEGWPAEISPVKASRVGKDSLLLSWNDKEAARCKTLGRWVYRLGMLRESEEDSHSLYFAFTCLPADAKTELRRSLRKAESPSGEDIDDAEAKDELRAQHDADPLTIEIHLKADGTPLFPNVFRYELLEDEPLPEGVFLDPMIVIKRPGPVVDFELTCENGILSPGRPDKHHRKAGNGPVLALEWRGVTEPKAGDHTSAARGFYGSWCRAIGKPDTLDQARLRWGQRSERTGPSIASLFFRNSPQVGRAYGRIPTKGGDRGTLVDPIIVYDEDSPPGG